MNLLSLLAQKNIINEEDAAAIEKEVEATGESAESLLLKKGVDSDAILQAKGDYLNIPTFSLGETQVPFEVLKHIPQESALHYRFVPIGMKEGVLEIGIVDADNIEALDALNFISSKENIPFKIHLISEDDFQKVLQMYKGLSQEVTQALGEYQIERQAEAEEVQKRLAKRKKDEKTTDIIKEDAPVTKIVANFLEHAVEEDASDIHIEPQADHVRVRFRIDGVLGTKLTIPSNVLNAIVSRIKILSSMRLDERRKPQDGRFSATVAGRRVDFRVSTFPSYYGEKVVMRILDTESGLITIDQLGFTESDLEIIMRAIQRTYGIILISGPTGSGKTTTLYAMLNEFDREKKNVLSLEDPIEYNIPGVSQSQVRPEIGYTFANGLRTTLRQDPDIIMVGEIRDKETAELAIQAALTGHLVLSTIHTNNAIGVIPRLVEMGIDPYLIAPTLVLAMAQRLVAKLCEGTGTPVPVDGGIKMMLDRQFNDLPQKFKKELPLGKELYDVEPSKDCPSGTKGRVAVFELLEVDKEIETIILTDPTDVAIEKAARKKGMLSMKEDAFIKSFQKIVPFREINTLGTEYLVAEGAVDQQVEKAKETPVANEGTQATAPESAPDGGDAQQPAPNK